jgi:hypothetical protein
MSRLTLRRASEEGLVVGAPLLLALVELFHPHPPHDLLDLDLRPWLAVHYAQIPLFALAALAVATLVRSQGDAAAALARLALFVFAVTYTAFDTAAGVVTGVLVQAARASATPEAWRKSIDAVWTNPIVGGSPYGPPPLLAVLGAMALAVGAIAAAASLRRAGRSWPPLALLVLSSFGITLFRTHAWPGGPLTFGGLAVAGRWLLWERDRRTA